MYKCTDCIHCETAYHQADGVCAPQRMCSSDPRSTRDNVACKYYEEAPLSRERTGLYGLLIYELWDSQEGRYIEDRPMPIL